MAPLNFLCAILSESRLDQRRPRASHLNDGMNVRHLRFIICSGKTVATADTVQLSASPRLDLRQSRDVGGEPLLNRRCLSICKIRHRFSLHSITNLRNATRTVSTPPIMNAPQRTIMSRSSNSSASRCWRRYFAMQSGYGSPRCNAPSIFRTMAPQISTSSRFSALPRVAMWFGSFCRSGMKSTRFATGPVVFLRKTRTQSSDRAGQGNGRT